MPSPYLDLLKLAAPELVVVLVALAVLAIDLLLLREELPQHRFLITGAFGCFGCIVAIFWNLNIHSDVSLWNGILVSDPLVRLVKAAILALTCFTLLIAMDSKFTEHIGEFVALVLLATVGMLFMVSSEELLTIFVSLELTSLSLYILTAFNKRNIKSAEAALKYFFFGAMASAFTLYGLSLIYGLSGSTYLKPISESLRGTALNPLLLVAIAMTTIGLGFKIAAVPFHLWAPDAYEGAPTPSAALIASGSKVASFFIFGKIFILGFASNPGSADWGQLASGWIPALAILAALSMILGNLAAIVQTNLRRLLAYSAISHAGYALLGVTAHSPNGWASLVYYTVTYGFTVLGAFGVVHVIEQTEGDASLTRFAGLSRRSPLLSFSMLVFMLSLAGIPPLAGFFGKFYLFAAATGSAKSLGLLWLIILAIAMSAVSLYYYLQVLKQIYVTELPAGSLPIEISMPTRIALCLLAAAVILLGCAPNLLLGPLVAAIRVAGV